jgi:PAS domain S-box-containing protein
MKGIKTNNSCVSSRLPPLDENVEDRLEQRTAVLEALNDKLRLEIVGRVAVEQVVREERNRFRTLVETIPNGIVEFDLDGTIFFANAEFHRMHGYAEGTLVGKCLWDVLKSIFPDGRNLIEGQLRDQPCPTPQFNSFRTPHGKCIDHKIDWNYRRDADGNVTGIVAIIADVTGQRRAEEDARKHLNQLAHVARVFTMNQMVSGLAHELNQPLAAISNFAKACRYQMLESADMGRYALLNTLEQISSQADRAAQIIRRLRDFVHRADSNRTFENINELAEDVLELLKVEIRTHNIQMEISLADDLPRILVDRIQIEQVITNLLKNAMEAVLDLSAEKRRVAIRTALDAEKMLEVSITDSGIGIEAAESIHLFEPFYTTKQSGMGLGLSISRSIVESHGGRLEARKNEAMGMTFRFTLPMAGKD